jgi:hypothetical protein
MNIGHQMSQWLRFFAWLSVVGLVLASWTPGEDMIRTGVRGSFEHIAAYLISTLLLMSASPRSAPWMIGAGILVGQIYVPGRHSGRLCRELPGGCDHYRADVMDSIACSTVLKEVGSSVPRPLRGVGPSNQDKMASTSAGRNDDDRSLPVAQ